MNALLTEVNKPAVLPGQRRRESVLPYAGEVTPQEAYRLFSAHGAKIIDVRSRVEYDYIGRVAGTTLIPWRFSIGGELNNSFLAELQTQCSTSDVVLFLCRSGVRSHAAAIAAAAAGFTHAFNIVEGFEGDLDQRGQRGHAGGWRKAGLPWSQS